MLSFNQQVKNPKKPNNKAPSANIGIGAVLFGTGWFVGEQIDEYIGVGNAVVLNGAPHLGQKFMSLVT